MTRLLGSRAFLSVTGTMLVVLVVVTGHHLHTGPAPRYRTYCALMPDAIGLYHDSKVTMRGIEVGTVRAISDHGATVRVEFTVAQAHPLRGQVSATTVADSVVADRDLAVLSENDGAPWDPATCLTRTLTPKSLTRTIEAVARMSEQLQSTVPGETGIDTALRAWERASAGTGDRVAALIHELGALLESPDVGIARLGRIIDALAVLTASADRGWSDLESMFTRFAATFDVLDNQLFPMVVELGDALRVVLPMLNDLSLLAGGALVGGLESAVPLLRWIGANIGGLQEVLRMVPAIASGFTEAFDPVGGAPRIAYAPPRFAAAGPEAAQVCATLEQLRPDLCDATTGAARVDLVRLVLGAAVTR